MFAYIHMCVYIFMFFICTENVHPCSYENPAKYSGHSKETKKDVGGDLS